MSHAELVQRAARWLRGRMRCGVVLTERSALHETGEIPDAIGWKSGHAHVVECKVSRADFLADREKRHRLDPMRGMGRFRYYMVLPGVAKAADCPAGFGLIEAQGRSARLLVPSQSFGISHEAGEKALLISELRRYQLHGITHPPLTPEAVFLAPRDEQDDLSRIEGEVLSPAAGSPRKP